MTTLSRELRRDLERTVIEARRVAEAGARKAIQALAVHHHEPWASMAEGQRVLRNRLRAHGRQLGDRRDQKKGTQETDHLVAECAYEHWHRMLFARFLAENGLLIEPTHGIALSLEECNELAREEGRDWLDLAASYATRMLPQIFRPGDPVLEINLPPETRHDLERLLETLSRDVFAADDSLGWVYQFWQAELKDQVNAAEKKVGADELPAVTQLFTEDYMVLFLLHNTLGAWWTAKRQAEGRNDNLSGYEWTYLRFNDDGTPAAGAFEAWPRQAKDVTVLDPCMGSGHFLVFALPILVAFRMEEEGLSREDAVYAVLRDNLAGLELDQRCTQIAAFNLALAAWRMVGYRPLPRLDLACSGVGINAREEDWLKLCGTDTRLRGAMQQLFSLFSDAPTLGSLIDPRRIGGDLFASEFIEVQPLLERALSNEKVKVEDASYELAVAAQGLVQAARLLARQFTLVATNVPYLARGKQGKLLRDYCERAHPRAKVDLATCFVERSLGFCGHACTAALVTPQSWLFQDSYQDLRRHLLVEVGLNVLVRLGSRAFETISGEVVNVALVGMTHNRPSNDHQFVGIDASQRPLPVDKSRELQVGILTTGLQREQLHNPGLRIVIGYTSNVELLRMRASSYQGIKTGDDGRTRRYFWEFGEVTARWRFFQSTVEQTAEYGGLEGLLEWHDEGRGLARRQGLGAWGKRGVMVSQMGQLPAAMYLGDAFDSNGSPVIPEDEADLLALFAYCSAGQYRAEVRKVDPSLKPTNASLVEVPFDLDYWRRAATERYPAGLPKPNSDRPTQWLFSGHPRHAEHALQVAVGRLLAYRWPRQTGSNFPVCPALGKDGLEHHADHDGIVCLPALNKEGSAAMRLGALLVDVYSPDWTAAKHDELLKQVNYDGTSLEGWLRDGFFQQHCQVFNQRPFVWHVWDGLKNGFSALVNYHKLAAPGGGGRKTLEKLTHTYLGDWITRQRADQKAGAEGADARVAAAEQLQKQLEAIVTGAPPFDIFVRWKPLYEQPLGWEPDINDGVRLNIRPFVMAETLNGKSILRKAPKIRWEKDRGKEPERPKEDFPWFWGWDEKTKDFVGGRDFDGNRWNDLHYSLAFKRAARERHGKGQPK